VRAALCCTVLIKFFLKIWFESRREHIFIFQRGDTLIAYEEMKKNKKLTEYEDIKEIVIANAVKRMKENKKTKENEQDRLLDEF